MSRLSRIIRPPGSRYVALHASDIRLFGLAGAAIIGLLDFLDRAQPQPRRPLASRARLIADLEGIVGRDQIDKALRALASADVLRSMRRTEMGKDNWLTRVEYALDAETLTHLLGGAGTPDFRSPGESGNQEAREFRESGRDPGQAIRKEEVDVAAHAPARRPADAAAPSCSKLAGGTRRRRGDEIVRHGVELWTPADVDGLAALIERCGAERIEQVAAGLTPAPGHQAPYLSAVVAAVQAHEAARAAEERRAAEVAKHVAEDKAILPPDAARQRAAAAKAVALTGRVPEEARP